MRVFMVFTVMAVTLPSPTEAAGRRRGEDGGFLREPFEDGRVYKV